MAYFSNGTEGMAYEERYCNRCVHEGPDDGPGCPVWMLHLIHNYDQTDAANDEYNGLKGDDREASPESRAWLEVLSTLIPEGDDHWPEQCTMFVEVEE